MDDEEVEKVKSVIDYLKTHFQSPNCRSSYLSKNGVLMVAELEEKLLSQDACICELQYNSGLYQAKRMRRLCSENKRTQPLSGCPPTPKGPFREG